MQDPAPFLHDTGSGLFPRGRLRAALRLVDGVVRPGRNGGLRGPGRAVAVASPVAAHESGPRGERSGVLQGAARGNQARCRARPLPPAARGGRERPRRGCAPPHHLSVRALRGATAFAAHPFRSSRAHRDRTAGGRLSPLCAPRPTHAARRAVGEPQSRAADEWRHRGGGGGGRSDSPPSPTTARAGR